MSLTNCLFKCHLSWTPLVLWLKEEYEPCLVWCNREVLKRRAKVGMCKEKNDTIVRCWSRSAESCSSLESGILSAWQEHKGWHLP